jgi:hypothetical protein
LPIHRTLESLNFTPNSAFGRPCAAPKIEQDRLKPNSIRMKLTARQAPGRTNRKARAFSDEIARLRREGHGLVAIQQALADAGVLVSVSTVRREVVRLPKQPPPQSARSSPTTIQYRPLQTGGLDPIEGLHASSGRPLGDKRSPREVAEDFLKGYITNPLFRKK